MTAATIGHASKPKSKRASSLWAENLSSLWFLLPIIVIFFILTVVPLVQSFLPRAMNMIWIWHSRSPIVRPRLGESTS